jgi:hypothetical protein
MRDYLIVHMLGILEGRMLDPNGRRAISFPGLPMLILISKQIAIL